MSARLLVEAESLLKAARERHGEAAPEYLDAVSRRLSEPLRVAIAGRLKAGKSTLLNALIGERVAATDATESTRIVTWYEDGPTYAAYRINGQGEKRTLRFERDGSATRILVEGEEPFSDEEQIHLEMPSPRLRAMTLIDTPGIDTASTELTNRAKTFFGAQNEVSPVDAVLYVIQHTHPADVAFLEAFHGDPGRGSPMNALAVLSRADEVGGGELDAMQIASAAAERAAGAGVIRSLVQTVVPVAGLLASAAETLQERQFVALRNLSTWESEKLERALLGVQPLLAAESDSPSEHTRLALVKDFGMFGIRLAIDLITRSVVSNSQEISDQLVEASGMRALRESLSRNLAARADLLKVRNALDSIARFLSELPDHEATDLNRRLEGVIASAHELTELAALDELRQTTNVMAEDDQTRLERLLGSEGAHPSQRLGVPQSATAAEIRAAAQDELDYWRRVATLGLMPGSRRFAEVAMRTCEGMIA